MATKKKNIILKPLVSRAHDLERHRLFCCFMKTCSLCKENKKYNQFGKLSSSKDGYAFHCKECRRKYYKPVVKAESQQLILQVKLCLKCESVKNTCEFNRDSSKYDGLYPVCKSCRKIRTHKKCNKCQEIKTADNFRTGAHNCKDCNVKYKKLCNVRSLILISFKNSLKGIYKKGLKTETIIGCNMSSFLFHIEKQFIKGMTWENHGKIWDLDHIIPISSAKSEEELYLLNHWSNFQPLDSRINRNIKKGKLLPVTNLELKLTKN